MSRYWEFIAEARTLYGFDLSEAREFWRDVRDELGHGGLDARDAASDAALDVLDRYLEDEGDEDGPDFYPPDERYELEMGEDDVWLDANEELEISVELIYQEG